MADDRPVLIKKVKIPADAHHGGAWKVAYADFVTAMMAFFLLLWLLNATEQETLEGISNYFTPTTQTRAGSSGSGGLFGGVTSNDPGPTDDKVTTADQDSETNASGELKAKEKKTGEDDTESTGSAGPVNAEQEEKRFNTQKKLLEKSLQDLPPELQNLKESIRVDITQEGLRIQIVDNRKNEAFQKGSSELTKHGRDSLTFISDYMVRLPNKVSISGHTSGVPGEAENWQLSLDRSNAARRELMLNRLPESRIANIVGKADSEPLIAENLESPQNRRMSIVLLRRAPLDPNARRTPPPSLLNRASDSQ